MPKIESTSKVSLKIIISINLQRRRAHTLNSRFWTQPPSPPPARRKPPRPQAPPQPAESPPARTPAQHHPCHPHQAQPPKEIRFELKLFFQFAIHNIRIIFVSCWAVFLFPFPESSSASETLSLDRSLSRELDSVISNNTEEEKSSRLCISIYFYGNFGGFLKKCSLI